MSGVTLGLRDTLSEWHKSKLELPVTLFLLELLAMLLLGHPCREQGCFAICTAGQTMLPPSLGVLAEGLLSCPVTGHVLPKHVLD